MLVSIRKVPFSALAGGGAAARMATQTFGGGGGVSEPFSTLREAVPMYTSEQTLDFLARTKIFRLTARDALPPKGGKMNDQIMPPFGIKNWEYFRR